MNLKSIGHEELHYCKGFLECYVTLGVCTSFSAYFEDDTYCAGKFYPPGWTHGKGV